MNNSPNCTSIEWINARLSTTSFRLFFHLERLHILTCLQQIRLTTGRLIVIEALFNSCVLYEMFFRLLWNKGELVNPMRMKVSLWIYWMSIICTTIVFPAKKLNKKKENLLGNGINFSEQAKKIFKNVHKYFSEEDHWCTLSPFSQVLRRVSEATAVSMAGVSRICYKFSECTNSVACSFHTFCITRLIVLVEE